jgi:carbon monoxide dehydrogenase subunit G
VRLEHNFEVPVDVQQAWQVLLDIERVVPCMPGATLTSHEGDDFTGTVKVKIGPVSLTYKGKGSFTEVDDAAHRIKIKASGADSRGAGTAAASVTAALVPAETDGHTRVEVVTDLDVTGKAAQFGRGLIGDVSSRLVGQFADCLAGKLAAEPAPAVLTAPSTEPVAAADVPAADPAPADPAPADRAGSAEGEPAADPSPATGSPAATGVPEPVVPEPGVLPDDPGVGSRGRATAVAEPVEAEPIDLLALAGVGSAVKRALPYVATAAASFLVVLSVIWWIRKR